MSRKQQRQNEIEARSKRKDKEHQHLKDNDIWYTRQEARNNNNNDESAIIGKLIGHLGSGCVDEQNHQIKYNSIGFYYNIVDENMVRVFGFGSKEQNFNVNSPYFQRNLHNFLDRSIAAV